MLPHEQIIELANDYGIDPDSLTPMELHRVEQALGKGGTNELYVANIRMGKALRVKNTSPKGHVSVTFLLNAWINYVDDDFNTLVDEIALGIFERKVAKIEEKFSNVK